MQRDQSLDRIRNRSRAADIVVIGGGATGIGVAMIVPKTVDGRVLFIIPWHDHAVVGTTDTPIDDLSLEPTAQSDEIEFLLKTTAEYLDRPPQRADVLTVFTGIRPLVQDDSSAGTASLSRDHVIRVSASGMLTVTGGKWTTVRKMAEDCVDRAVQSCQLEASKCMTRTLAIHGHTSQPSEQVERGFYSSDLMAIERLEADRPELARPLCQGHSLRGSDVVWAVRHEMARTVEDVLARRSRLLFVDVKAAIGVAPQVARLIADELGGHEFGYDDAWCESRVGEFEATAKHYRMPH